jgi:hypothetical protein
MLAVAALAVLGTPTFEELSKRNTDPFRTHKIGTAEYRYRLEGPSDPLATGVTLRFSNSAKGSVFEATRDGQKIMRVMNDGKTVSVQATGAGVQCRVPATRKDPIDLSMIRIRPEGKSLKLTFLGTPSNDAFKGFQWENTLDKADVLDGVSVRRLGYVGKKEGSPEVAMECWLDKKTSEFRFMRYKVGEGSISVALSFSPAPISLPSVPLSKAVFKGYDSVPLSLVREKIAALWAVPEADAKEG